MAMKQFEKWWKNYSCNLPINCGDLSCHNCKKIREEAWKAALECVKDEMLPNCLEPLDIYDSIEDELNGNK